MSGPAVLDEDAVLERIRLTLEARSTLVASIAAGERPPADVVEAPDETALATRVLVILEAAPGASKVASRRLLAELGIDELATVAEVGHGVRAALTGRLRSDS